MNHWSGGLRRKSSATAKRVHALSPPLKCFSRQTEDFPPSDNNNYAHRRKICGTGRPAFLVRKIRAACANCIFQEQLIHMKKWLLRQCQDQGGSRERAIYPTDGKSRGRKAIFVSPKLPLLHASLTRVRTTRVFPAPCSRCFVWQSHLTPTAPSQSFSYSVFRRPPGNTL